MLYVLFTKTDTVNLISMFYIISFEILGVRKNNKLAFGVGD